MLYQPVAKPQVAWPLLAEEEKSSIDRMSNTADNIFKTPSPPSHSSLDIKIISIAREHSEIPKLCPLLRKEFEKNCRTTFAKFNLNPNTAKTALQITEIAFHELCKKAAYEKQVFKDALQARDLELSSKFLKAHQESVKDPKNLNLYSKKHEIKRELKTLNRNGIDAAESYKFYFEATVESYRSRCKLLKTLLRQLNEAKAKGQSAHDLHLLRKNFCQDQKGFFAAAEALDYYDKAEKNLYARNRPFDSATALMYLEKLNYLQQRQEKLTQEIDDFLSPNVVAIGAEEDGPD